MVRDWTFWGLSLILMLSIFSCAAAQNDEGTLAANEIDQKIQQATGKYRRAQFEDAVIMTSSLLAKQNLSLKQETDALLILAMSEVNRGQSKEARAYLERLSELDPTVNLNPDEYPPQMMKIWYSVEREIPDTLRPSVLGQNALAVLYFDNSSISKDQKDLDPLCKGLASMMIQDIAKSGTVKVVERDRINFLVDELKLQQSDLTDKNTAVKMGKLVGAKTLLMGGFMKLDNKNFKIYGRLVSVETGEIIKVAEVEGNPKDIFELQKELVFKILDDMNMKVDKKAEKKINQGKDAKYEALYHYSLGLALEDKDDYKAAYAEYQKALKLAPGYAEAEIKMNKLEPMALKG